MRIHAALFKSFPPYNTHPRSYEESENLEKVINIPFSHILKYIQIFRTVPVGTFRQVSIARWHATYAGNFGHTHSGYVRHYLPFRRNHLFLSTPQPAGRFLFEQQRCSGSKRCGNSNKQNSVSVESCVFQGIVNRICRTHGSVSNWQTLYSSIYNAILIGRICGTHSNVSTLLANVGFHFRQSHFHLRFFPRLQKMFQTMCTKLRT